MNCDFCAKRIGEFIVIIQNKQVHICQTCNKKWQLDVKAGVMLLRDNMRVEVKHCSGIEYGVIESAKDASKAVAYAMKVTVKMDDGTFCAFPISWMKEAK